MRRLPNGSIDVPALGFGCAYLVGGGSSGASAKVIDAALHAGIRHFDVAPLYGLGTAEGVLGELLGSRRPTVSLASKVGIDRPQPSRMALALRRLPPSLRARLRTLLPQGQGPSDGIVTTRFDLDWVKRSVDKSLGLLRTDYLDVLLLHEARVGNITDDLMDYLEGGRKSGMFRAVGIGSERDAVDAIAKAFPGSFDIFQYEWDVLKGVSARISEGTACITHRAISGAFDTLRSRLQTDRSWAQSLARSLDIDVNDPDELSRVLLGAAVARNPGGVTLFGTRSPSRIASNMMAQDERYIVAGNALADALKGGSTN